MIDTLIYMRIIIRILSPSVLDEPASSHFAFASFAFIIVEAIEKEIRLVYEQSRKGYVMAYQILFKYIKLSTIF